MQFLWQTPCSYTIRWHGKYTPCQFPLVCVALETLHFRFWLDALDFQFLSQWRRPATQQQFGHTTSLHADGQTRAYRPTASIDGTSRRERKISQLWTTGRSVLFRRLLSDSSIRRRNHVTSHGSTSFRRAVKASQISLAAGEALFAVRRPRNGRRQRRPDVVTRGSQVMAPLNRGAWR